MHSQQIENLEKIQYSNFLLSEGYVVKLPQYAGNASLLRINQEGEGSKIVVCTNKEVLGEILKLMPQTFFEVRKVFFLSLILGGGIFHIHDFDADAEIPMHLGAKLFQSPRELKLFTPENQPFKWGDISDGDIKPIAQEEFFRLIEERIGTK